MKSEPTGTTQTQVDPAGSPETLPEFWPDRPTPVRVRPIWIPWPVAVLLAPLFWLFPTRLGPHVSAAGWRAAIAGTLVWTVYGTATVTMGVFYGYDYGLITWLAGRTPEQMGARFMPVATFSEIIRAPLAVWVRRMQVVDGSMMPVDGLHVVLGAAGSLVALGFVVLTLALLLMAYIAAGERLRTLLARTIRLVMWALTSLVVLGWALQVVDLFAPSPPGWRNDYARVLAVLVYSIWAVSLLLRSGSRYSGPAMGDAWQQRVPTCQGCGYILTALPVTGMCPECGEPIAASLPALRRPSRFAAAPSIWTQVAAYWPTWWAVLTEKQFFAHLAMEDGHAAARRFAIWSYGVLAGVTEMVVTALAFIFENARPKFREEFLDILGAGTTFAGVAFLACIVLGGVLALIVSRFGRRDFYRRSVVVFYSAVWAGPVLWSVILALTLTEKLADNSSAYGVWVVMVPGAGRADLYDLLTPLPLLLPLFVIWLAIARLVRALRQSRYANA